MAAAIAACFSVSFATPVAAQRDTTDRETRESDAEAAARMARRGAGITVGQWDLRGIEAPADVPLARGEGNVEKFGLLLSQGRCRRQHGHRKGQRQRTDQAGQTRKRESKGHDGTS